MADQEVPPNQTPPASDGTINPAQPSADDRSDTARLEKRKKLVLRQGAGETSEVPAAGDTQGSQLVDPTRRRDTNTASLKRLRPQEGAAAAPQVDEDTTETVNIKVIKEQKKQFRNMMTSSQTLRVKPEDAAEAPDLAATPSQQAAAADGGDKQRTLKIKSPAQTDARTESIQRSQVAPSAMPTAEVPAAATASPKSTLKIKAPPGVAPAQASGPKPGATLKIKAPAPSAAQTQVTETPTPAETVRQPPPAAKAGKTMKLRQGTQAAMAAGGSAAAQAAAAPAPAEYDTMAVPGWGYFLPAVASMALIIGVIVYSIKSAQLLFNGQLL